MYVSSQDLPKGDGMGVLNRLLMEMGEASATVPAVMEYNEHTLREVLASPYGQSCGQSLLDMIIAGEVVTVAMNDGRTLLLSELQTARGILSEMFQWKPGPLKAEFTL